LAGEIVVVSCLACSVLWRGNLGKGTRNETLFFSLGQSGCLSDFRLLFFGLLKLNLVVNQTSVLGLDTRLLFGHVESVRKRSMPLVHTDVLKAAAVRLQTHVEGNCVAVRVLPVAYARWNFPVILILLGQFPRRGPHDDRGLTIGRPHYFFMLVTRGTQWVLNSGRNLDNALHAWLRLVCCCGCVADEFVLLPLLEGLGIQERVFSLALNFHTEVGPRLCKVLFALLGTWAGQICVLQLCLRRLRISQRVVSLDERNTPHFSLV
jgi:hypothetical protein